ncbi:MAG: 50S ribosomal protein L29 [Deltaproteobacteria bacterium]|nr:50S ribosomal protein L29 [Deltaproteobacteria bacterium]MCL5791679.1 50S ribosomal protein L29 [Deltaproteobacteria bacterium]
MKASEIRAFSADEIKEKISDKRKELFNLKLKVKTAQLNDYRSYRLMKKDLAKLLTILREKEKGINAK